MERWKLTKRHIDYLDRMETFYSMLTLEEIKIIELAVSGRLNKEIAVLIGRSIKTVERIIRRVTHKFCSFFHLSGQVIPFRDFIVPCFAPLLFHKKVGSFWAE